MPVVPRHIKLALSESIEKQDVKSENDYAPFRQLVRRNTSW
jgi:hypothetical protein